MRCSISWEGSPAYCQMIETTGILIAGKMSVGVRSSRYGVSRSSTSDATMKVSGRRKARRTIHIQGDQWWRRLSPSLRKCAWTVLRRGEDDLALWKLLVQGVGVSKFPRVDAEDA